MDKKGYQPIANSHWLNFKQKAFAWANDPKNGFQIVAYLDNNGHDKGLYNNNLEILLGVAKNAHKSVEKDGYTMGFLTYDLKNHIEPSLSSNNFDGIDFPLTHLFSPDIVVKIQLEEIEIITEKKEDAAKIEAEIWATNPYSTDLNTPKNIQMQPRMNKAEYLETVEKIRQHIIEGDLYEMNLCQEFFAENVSLDSALTFAQMNHLAKAPFSAFYRLGNHVVMCCSPERFLKKFDSTLISQPIKGTIKRGKTEEEDKILQEQLRNDPKNRAENVMIVDLVRNDLAKISEAGTVRVPELMQIYGFPTVSQMISTIIGNMKKNISFSEIIAATFPMGSMTGAPKVMAMQLIEQYEKTKRGIYSGSIGYINPNGDMDWNVVIRSLVYNSETKYLSFQVGGAIVFDSNPEEEYEECLLKAKNMLKVLQ